MRVISRPIFNLANMAAKKIGRTAGADFTMVVRTGKAVSAQTVMTASFKELSKEFGKLGAIKIIAKTYGILIKNAIAGLLKLPIRILRNTPGIKKLFKQAAQEGADNTPKMLLAPAQEAGQKISTVA